MSKALKTLAHREEPLGLCWVGPVQLAFGLGWHLSRELRDERSCLQQAQQAGAESSRQGSSGERPWERGTGTSWGRRRGGGGAGQEDPVGQVQGGVFPRAVRAPEEGEAPDSCALVPPTNSSGRTGGGPCVSVGLCTALPGVCSHRGHRALLQLTQGPHLAVCR